MDEEPWVKDTFDHQLGHHRSGKKKSDGNEKDKAEKNISQCGNSPVTVLILNLSDCVG